MQIVFNYNDIVVVLRVMIALAMEQAVSLPALL